MHKDYGELFDEHLEESLRTGGEPSHMVAVAKIYEGQDDTLRDYAFREWAHGRQFSCSKCQAMYSPSGDMGRWDEVLCSKCRMRKEDCR